MGPDRTMRWSLAVALRRGEAGPQLAVEPVTEADLAEHRAEAWFTGCLRKGRRGLALSQVPMRVAPERRAAGRCSGFFLEVLRPGEPAARQLFSARSLVEVALRLAERLVAAGTLAVGETFSFEVLAQPESAPPAPAPDERLPVPCGMPSISAARFSSGRSAVAAAPPAIAFKAREIPLRFASVPVRPLLARAARIGPDLEGFPPVFYTQGAFEAAERFSRRGAERNPPAETGAVLIGPLCACPETGEVFVVVIQVNEVTEAEEKEFTLAYSGRSWSRIQEAVRALRCREATRSWRLLGQSHGHNFRPRDGEQLCESCPQLAICRRTSVFVSDADQKWSRAVFHGQPWHLCHIFGLTARGERVHGLFGQRDGRLQERPFHLIPEFDPLAWPEV